MDIQIRPYQENDLPDMIEIWNEAVEGGVVFPQENPLPPESARQFFAGQTYNAVAADAASGEVYGLYILHPNNVGRCGHISNASFAVRTGLCGLYIGEKLVRDCISQAKLHGF